MHRLTTAKRKPSSGDGPGKAILTIAVVLLIGGGVGAYFWNRAAATGVARRYMALSMSLEGVDTGDFRKLKQVVTEADVTRLTETEAAMNGAPNPVWSLLAEVMSEATVDVEVSDASVGLTEAAVETQTTAATAERTTTLPGVVILVREGLAWKVDRRASEEASYTAIREHHGLPEQ
ncbi:MAG TPA: hypothetical protein QGH10_01885 [Armatimonadota bacterium]|nr:hypothetical protein [Armatimonadota bacterium]